MENEVASRETGKEGGVERKYEGGKTRSAHCIVLYCIVLYCIVLYCIVLYCIVLYCIVLYLLRLPLQHKAGVNGGPSLSTS